MKILYILTHGMNQPDLDTLRQLESQDRYPRTSDLESRLKAIVLDGRHLAKARGLKGWIYARIPMPAAQVIEALLLSRRVDVIFSHAEKSGLPLALLMRILRIRTPHVITIWRITSADPTQASRKAWLMRAVFPVFTTILVWSSRQRDILVHRLGVPSRKVQWLRYGIDERFWRPMDRPMSGICSVGMEMRDYPTLVHAIDGTGIPCHIATGQARGELFQTVRRLYDIPTLPAEVTVGRKDYPGLRELYASSRFVVVPLLPTDSDNGLTSILESMAMGKTVICTRVEGQIDIIEEGVTGLFVPQGDVNALREAILTLWRDPDRAERMGRQAREFVMASHRLDPVIERIEGLVRSAARQESDMALATRRIVSIGMKGS